MDDEVGLHFVDKPQHRLAVADVDIVMLEAARAVTKALEVPRGVPVLPKEIATHVVVDTVDAPPAFVEERDGFGADQAA